MEMVYQCLQALFVHEISKITQGCGEYKEEYGCASDDGYFDPFQSGKKGDTQEEDVPGKSDEYGDEERVLVKEWKGGGIFPDGKEDDGDDDQCAGPP